MPSSLMPWKIRAPEAATCNISGKVQIFTNSCQIMARQVLTEVDAGIYSIFEWSRGLGTAAAIATGAGGRGRGRPREGAASPWERDIGPRARSWSGRGLAVARAMRAARPRALARCTRLLTAAPPPL